MTVLSAQSIMKRKPIKNPQPRTEIEVNGRRYTHGCGPCGYDLTLDSINTDFEDKWIIRPGQFLLASAAEEFDMPDCLVGRVHDKSSWARCGLAVQNTVIEPGWRGFLTLELTNHSNQDIDLYPGVGICQVIFDLLDFPTNIPYGSGKYQDQPRGPQEAL